MKFCCVRLILVVVAAFTIGTGAKLGRAIAEEAGSGHYLPGATASFIDMLPDRDAFSFVYANAFTYYEGSNSNELELGGLIAANVKGTIYADTSLFLAQTPWKLLGGAYG